MLVQVDKVSLEEERPNKRHILACVRDQLNDSIEAGPWVIQLYTSRGSDKFSHLAVVKYDEEIRKVIILTTPGAER